jgi:hypothetical protein
MVSHATLLACDLTRWAGWGWPSTEVGGCGGRAGWAGQAAFAVLLGFFLGLVAGFLIAGSRTAGPEARPLGRPGELAAPVRRAGSGAAALPVGATSGAHL